MELIAYCDCFLVGCLPTDSLVKILQGMSNRVTSKKSKINGRAEQLIKHIAEVVSERAQQGGNKTGRKFFGEILVFL